MLKDDDEMRRLKWKLYELLERELKALQMLSEVVASDTRGSRAACLAYEVNLLRAERKRMARLLGEPSGGVVLKPEVED
jgi:hypothetical protein